MADAETPAASAVAPATTAATEAVMKPLSEEVSAKVLRQVDYYFSDSNLPRDNFLSEKVEEGGGYVSIALLCSFSRMRGHLGLSGDESTPDTVPRQIVQGVADVLRSSSLLNVSDDGEKVGRKVPLEAPDKAIAEVDARSLYASPLPWNITMDEIESFFSQVGEVKSVRMRKYSNSKDFTGSVYVEFSSREEAQRVLGERLVFQGATLKMEFKMDYEERVKNERKERSSYIREEDLRLFGERQPTRPSKEHYAAKQQQEEEAEKEAGSADYEKGLILALKVIKKNEGTPTGEEESKREDMSAEGDEDPAGEDEEGPIRRDDFKEALQKYGVVKYVDFLWGASTGYVRFETASQAARVVEASKAGGEKGLEIKNSLFVSFSLLEGEEEKEYWAKLRAGQGRRRDNNQGWSHSGRGGRFGGRGRGGGGGRGGRFGGGRGRFGGGRRGGRDSGGSAGRGSPAVSHKRFREDDGDGGPTDSKVARGD